MFLILLKYILRKNNKYYIIVMFKNYMINFIYIFYFDLVIFNIEYWCDNFKLFYIIVWKIK